MTKHVLDYLDEIAATSGKKEKERLVGLALEESVAFWNVVKAACNPFVTYGVTQPAGVAPGEGQGSAGIEWSGVWEVLIDLSSRRLTGTAALTAIDLMLAHLDAKSAVVFRRILDRDLRAGFTEGTVNRVRPGTIPVFDVMLAHKFEEKRVKKWPVAVEPKLDGVRVICIVRPDSVRFFSRTGKPFTAFDHIAEELLAAKMTYSCDPLSPDFNKVNAFVLDGEVVSGIFNETVGAVRRKSKQATDAVFNVFDILPLQAFEDDKLRTIDVGRRSILTNTLSSLSGAGSVRMIERRIANSVDDVLEIYAKVRAAGGEGVIVKPLNGFYEKKRSFAWMKIKAIESIDVPVTGSFEGNGKYVGKLGGLIVDVDGVEVRVGGGFSDAQRDEFWAEMQRPVNENELVGRLIEVEYHEKTVDGSLRHPRFVRFRDDKDRKVA